MYKRYSGMLAGTLLTVVGLAVVGLTGCSNGSSSSSTVSVKVWVSQGDFDDAYVWSTAVTEGGQLSVDSEGRLSHSEYDTDEDSEIKATIASEEVQQFTLVGKVEDTDLDVPGTTRLCQWMDGCITAAATVAFGERYSAIGSLWRTVAYDLQSDERVRLTPFTDLAATLAYERLYLESTAEWDTTGYYSAWSVVQSVSQLSRLLGVEDIQTTRPADLTHIDNWNGSQASTLDQIRYGALVSAWSHLEESYAGDTTLVAEVGADIVTNDGQWLQSGDSQTVSLAQLFQLARDNLAALEVTNTTAATYVATVIGTFDTDIAALQDGELTAVVPETIENLVGSGDYDDFILGLQRTKAFVDTLRTYQDSFFEEGYREEVDAYLDMVKAVGDDNADEFQALIDAYLQTYELYTSCYLNAGCPTQDSSMAWLTSIDSYNSATGILKLNDGAITVSQRVADVNTTDDDDEPDASHAIDVLIVGTYQQGDLVFNIDHYYENDDDDNDIERPSAVRVYYTDEVSQLADSSSNEIIGYELRWGDFEFYDQTTLNTADELEFDGYFRLFYRGVRDPLDATSALRFNIDTVVLDSRVSDNVKGDNGDDDEYADLYVGAAASNAAEFYPDQEFAPFTGFFTPNSSADFAKGTVASGLLSYATGSETVKNQAVEYLDIHVPLGESLRYRLYPTIEREDESDVDGDDDLDELVNTYDTEECYLVQNGSTWAVDTCEPKNRYYGEADFTDYVNTLWASGVLSRISIDGRGTYFVEWAANSTDSNGCMVLDDLESSSADLDGTLYDPMVLGLNTLRFQTEVILDNQPDTLLDVYINAPTVDDYRITAALSHDYSSTSTSGYVTIGSGSSLDRIILNYRTDYTFETTGSLAIYKDGVSLSLDDGSTDKVDSTLTLYLNESNGADPLPYTYLVNDEGDYERCVTSNQAEWDESYSLDTATFYLNYRDVVYGRITKENGTWVVRYIDGTFETLQ
ncbi:hypothetical protein [Oceanobacter antarcticus]|uniref:Uncharacterized protein n=1 Tax=Oceanobacter antarcticus TaxID=3133425 RepID=A0ABW8NG18_9GAMM